MTYRRDACMGSTIEASFFGVVKLKSPTIEGNTHNNLFFWNSKFQVDTKSVPNIEIPSRMTFKIFFFTSIQKGSFEKIKITDDNTSDPVFSIQNY